jgi:hypothetical protein
MVVLDVHRVDLYQDITAKLVRHELSIFTKK